mmetsp:Transcript_11123/g.33052  ORF Transcript_11123/g.33052 Transcript_11123/m.33052 type:complete len:335 (-) Transcript_11123:6-1010(-)
MSLAAISRLRSGAETRWFLAPPRAMTFLPALRARACTRSATREEPTKVSAAMSGWSQRALATSESPWTIWKAPCGTPALKRNSAALLIVIGTFSEGLRITQLPATRAIGMVQKGTCKREQQKGGWARKDSVLACARRASNHRTRGGSGGTSSHRGANHERKIEGHNAGHHADGVTNLVARDPGADSEVAPLGELGHGACPLDSLQALRYVPRGLDAVLAILLHNQVNELVLIRLDEGVELEHDLRSTLDGETAPVWELGLGDRNSLVHILHRAHLHIGDHIATGRGDHVQGALGRGSRVAPRPHALHEGQDGVDLALRHHQPTTAALRESRNTW